MKLNKLYDIAKNEKIHITNYKMKNTKARIIDKYIFMNYSDISTYIEEKELLAEELGHYKYNAYYTLLDNQEFINKQEYKAKKWKALHLCPLKSILRCIKERKDKYI